MITLIDYETGNLRSVAKALEAIGADVCISRRVEDLHKAGRIVLPGQGAFQDSINSLRQTGLIEPLHEQVKKGKPLFGICLGLELLARESCEDGQHQGLGWLDAEVVRFEFEDSALKIPHIGWNDVHFKRPTPMTVGLGESPEFYFAHSYYLAPKNDEDVAATCDYGIRFCAAVQKDNLFATQFHPEKSQKNGLRLLSNFLKWNPG